MPQPVGVPPAVPTFAPPQLPKQHSPIGLIIAVVLLGLLLIGTLAFAFWAFAERQDYKNNAQEKIDAAVVVAEKETTDANNARFAEESKSPVKTYVGPSSYGSINFEYPKTWSGYIEAVGGSGTPFHAYFHPDVVPESGNGKAEQAVALQIEVRDEAYDKVVGSVSGDVAKGSLTASPYSLPKVTDQVGTKFVGKITNTLNGTQYVLPLRDKTLVITTQTDQYLGDLNTYILPNFTFQP